MVAGRALRKVNGTATVVLVKPLIVMAAKVLVKPLIVMAAKVLGPGPTRLRLVKLAHHLDHTGAVVVPAEGRFDELPQPAVQPTRRAA